MTNLNPEDYENGVPIDDRAAGAIPADDVAVAVGETVNSADPSITLGPGKAIAAGVTGIGLAVVIGAINAVTPDLFAGLGPWGGVVYAGVVALGASLATYLTRTTVTGN